MNYNQGLKKTSTSLLMNVRILNYTYNRCWLLFILVVDNFWFCNWIEDYSLSYSKRMGNFLEVLN